MDIDDLFLSISDLIAQVPEIKHIDMDFGQLDNFEVRPSVAFPCALISIDFPQTNNLGNKIQKPQVVINVKMGFDYTGQTWHRTPTAFRERALSYYGTVKDVYKELQGQRLGTTTLKRQSQIESARPDQIKIIEMAFGTEFLDESAAV